MTIRKAVLGWLVLVAGFFPGIFAEERPESNVVFGKPMDLEMELVTVPDAVGSGGKPMPAGAEARSSQDGRWLRIDVPFATRKKFTPEVKFKFFLEGYEVVEAEKGGKDTEKFVVLTGEVTYRDVPQGAKHYAGMFLAPPATLRYAGLKANGENDWASKKMNLRVEASEQGTPVEEPLDLQSDKEKGPSGRGGKKNAQWHTGAPPAGSADQPGQVVDGVLLAITDTPFWPKDFKRYPQLKRP